MCGQTSHRKIVITQQGQCQFCHVQFTVLSQQKKKSEQIGKKREKQQNQYDWP